MVGLWQQHYTSGVRNVYGGLQPDYRHPTTRLEFSSWSHWRCKSIFVTPSVLQSITESCGMNPQEFSPFGQYSRDAVERHRAIVRLVASLLFACSPTAVARRVVLCGVLPVESCIRWTFSHVGKEVFKLVPSFADSNAFVVVLPADFGFSVLASLDHRHPSSISRRQPASGVSMCCAALLQSLKFVAAARFGDRTADNDALEHPFRSAFAAAKPLGLTLLGIHVAGQDRPAMKLLAD